MGFQALLVSVLLPCCLSISYFLLGCAAERAKKKKRSSRTIVVEIPKFMAQKAGVGIGVFVIVVLCFTFFSKEPPHWILYLTFGTFIWVGTYLLVKSLNFKVVVQEDTVCVTTLFRRTYSFSLDEIQSVKRQTKNNLVGSERMVIKTTTGRKVIVESAEIGYVRFREYIQTHVANEKLTGFENLTSV